MSGETLMTSEVKVPDILRKFIMLYEGDGDLVRPGAEHHHVQVVDGDIFDALSQGNYNFRIPRGTDEKATQKLIGAKRIAIVCEDYRQSAEVAQVNDFHPESGEDAVIGIAGGAAQPDKDRFNALVDFVVVLSKANPEIKWLFAVHDEVCGGANHFTQGKMKQIREIKGDEAEQARMNEFLENLIKAVIDRGVNKANISKGMAIVQQNKFVTFK